MALVSESGGQSSMTPRFVTWVTSPTMLTFLEMGHTVRGAVLRGQFCFVSFFFKMIDLS